MGTTVPTADSIRRLARDRLGFEQLRPGQLDAISAAAAGHSVVAVLPTGAGKSAIYELAGLLRTGPTVVVSPLIALEDDQLAHLRDAGLSATVVNSKLSSRARTKALSTVGDPDEFVFVAPEQLSNPETRSALMRVQPGLFVVDEAHLVSQWGQDFRPDYLRLSAQADALGVDVRMALTATAAPPVRDEIIKRLGLQEPKVVIGDFNRPEISLSVRRVFSREGKRRAIEEAASDLEGSGIVYAATRAGAQEARDVLAAAGHNVTLYHAGLPIAVRRQAMQSFLDGSTRIMAATVAFGMGIDKADVRWVVHADPPGSIDAYYQEIGRGGRDGKPAQAQLLYHDADLAVVRHLAVRSGVSEATVADVAHRLADGLSGDRVDHLEGGTRSTRSETLALARLVDIGAASWIADGGVRWSGLMSVPSSLEASAQKSTREQEVQSSRFEMMRRYAEHTGCRRSFLLTYFGQDYPGPCGNCDNDLHRPATPHWDEPFPIGARVATEHFGEGTIQRYDRDQVTILFDDHGYRDVLVSTLVEKNVTRPL
jgi:ATP-dependent DNA helicase RecQ